MAKRIQPKLSRPKAEIISSALHTAGSHHADRLLGRLYLISVATTLDAQIMWEGMAAEAVRDLKDCAALVGISAEDFLRLEVSKKEKHAFFLGQALAMLEEPTERAAA